MPAPIADPDRYLERLSKPLQEKLRIARFLPAEAATILDVGCADGAVTLALAVMFPARRFLGIDLDAAFIERARAAAVERGLGNVQFENVYLRELLARPARHDAVLFVSVLHEFYSYGEGISSVVKALADAHELLRPGGVIVIRDMILEAYAREAGFQTHAIAAKIAAVPGQHRLLADFTARFGPLDCLAQVNHYLLKYLYADNWERECAENYVPVDFAQYEQLFRLLGMELLHRESYLLPYLRQRWAADFGLSDDELAGLRSTGILVARKPPTAGATGGTMP